MSSPLLKSPALEPGVAATLAGHPRAASMHGNPQAGATARATGSVTATVAEASRVVAQRTAEELDALRTAAHEEGLRQGRQEAQRQLEQAMMRHDAALQTMVANVDAAVRESLAGLEAFALSVAYQACGTVLSQAALDGSAVTDAVRTLLQPLRQAGGVRVNLHPDDIARVAHALRDDPLREAHAIRFQADPALTRGDCRVVTPHGQLESGLAIQLDAIRDALVAAHATLQSKEDAQR